MAVTGEKKNEDNPTTVHDVAKLAGVSISTVSMVINNKDKFVSPELRKKVKEADRYTLNYQPNLVARSLKIEETKSIGLIVHKYHQSDDAPLWCEQYKSMPSKTDLIHSSSSSEEDRQQWKNKLLFRV